MSLRPSLVVPLRGNRPHSCRYAATAGPSRFRGMPGAGAAMLVLGLLLSVSVSAQQGIFVPERPGQTWSTDVVEPGYLHFEAGVLMQRAGFTPARVEGALSGGEVYRHTVWQLPAMMLRLGVTEHVEVRIATKYLRTSWRFDPNYFYADTSGEPMEEGRNSGVDVLNVGFKTLVTTERGWIPQTAVLVSMALPGLSSPIHDISQPAPDIAMSFSHMLADDLYLGYCSGLSWDGMSVVPIAYASAMLAIDLDERMNLFIEYGLETRYHAPVLHTTDAGLVFKASDNLMLDAWAGFGLGDPEATSSSPHYSSIYRTDFFIGAGAAYRLRL